MTELDALKQATKGDRDAYRVLVELYQDRVFGHVLSMVSRRALAEDLTQEIFVKAYFALPRFKRDASFFTWIYRIATNHCMDQLRRKRLHEQPLDAPLDDETAHTLADVLSAPASDLPNTGVENAAELADLLNGLEPDQKQILILREVEGYAYEELAELFKCPLNTVKSRLNRAREALKAIYVQKYGGLVVPRGNISASETVQDKGEGL